MEDDGSERTCTWNRWGGNKCIAITSFKQCLALLGLWLPLHSLSHSSDWENSQKDGPKGHTLTLTHTNTLPPLPRDKLYKIMLSSLICEGQSTVVITWRQHVVWGVLMNHLIHEGLLHNECILSGWTKKMCLRVPKKVLWRNVSCFCEYPILKHTVQTGTVIEVILSTDGCNINRNKRWHVSNFPQAKVRAGDQLTEPNCGWGA